MKIKLLLMLMIAFFGLKGNAQIFDWVDTFNLGDDIPRAVATDVSGNVYTTGNYTNSGGSTSIMFIRKNDALGAELWTKFITGGANRKVQGLSIAIDNSENILISGIFNTSVDFNPGAGVFTMSAIVRNENVFILKLDNNGGFIWAKQINGPEGDFGRGIAVDASNNVYTTGFFKGTVDFNPNVGVTNLTANGSDLSKSDIFIQKLDASGNFIWAKSFGANNFNDEGTSISIDNLGNVYTTGYFVGTADFDPGVGVSMLTSGGGIDTFIQKLDASGNFIWAKSISGMGNNIGNSIATDGTGNSFVTGYFDSTADFDASASNFNLTPSGSRDAYILKLDAMGNFTWVKQIGGTGLDFGIGITLDALDNIYTTGYFANTCDFDPGSGISNEVSNGDLDAFVQKLDASGNFVWVAAMGSSGQDVGRAIVAEGNSIYTVGSFNNMVDFDPISGVMNATAVSARDGFIQKLSNLCIVNIPDANFKNYLVGNIAINTNGDTEIQCSEASAYTGAILINGSVPLVTDFTGLEAFTSLTSFSSNGHMLTTPFNVSNNTMLTSLIIVNAQLTSLDVSANTQLTQLICVANQLSNLDVSNNTMLTFLDVNTNQLTSLDVSANTILTDLYCGSNSLTSIDVSNNLMLNVLSCSFNSISTLDVSTNTSLLELDSRLNSLSTLNVSTNTQLTRLFCSDNLLTSLNVANGNNSNMVGGFTAVNNPNLNCVQVDSGFTPPNSIWSIDATANYSDNCTLGIDDIVLENGISIYPNPAINILYIKMPLVLKQARIYSVLGDEVLKTPSSIINTSNLESGLYLIKIEDETGVLTTKRFIKQ